MNQLAATTQEMEVLRQQSYQADVKASDAKAGVDEVAQRVLAMETEGIRIRDNGSHFVDIKTLDANCDRLRAALKRIEFSKEMVDEMTVDSLGFHDNPKIDKRLNQFLMAYTDLAAMTFVENAHGSGFEAWRKLTGVRPNVYSSRVQQDEHANAPDKSQD